MTDLRELGDAADVARRASAVLLGPRRRVRVVVGRLIVTLALAAVAGCAPDPLVGPPPVATRRPGPGVGPALRRVPDGAHPTIVPLPDGPPPTELVDAVRAARAGSRPSVASGDDASLAAVPAPPSFGGGMMDLVWHQAGTGNFGIWHMDLTAPITTAAGWAPFEVSPGWKVEAAADFDGDGYTDLLFHQTGTGNFGIWLLQQDRLRPAAGSWISFVASPGWDVVGAARFDGDLAPDLLFRNLATGQAGLWRMQWVTPMPNGWVPLDASPGWHPDAPVSYRFTRPESGPRQAYGVVWHQGGTGNFGVWLMDGTAQRRDDAGWRPFTASPGWEIIDTAPFDADMIPDLLWRNATTGEHGIWRLAGDLRPSAEAGAWSGLTGSSGWLTEAAGDFGAVTDDPIVALSTGYGATNCGVGRSGALYCGADSTRPVSRIAGIVAPTSVSGVGWSFSDSRTVCAVVAGQGFCWGNNATGQVGNGTVGGVYSSPQAIAVPGNTPLRSVVLSASRACAVTEAESLLCWGQTYTDGTPTSYSGSPTPRPLPPEVTRLRAVSIGDSHGCVLADAGATTGQVDCWGDNTRGQLGTPEGGVRTTLLPVPMPSGVTSFQAVTTGATHTCALAGAGTKAGRVFCWGRAGYPLSGGEPPPDPAALSVPTEVALPTGARAMTIAAGLYHTCALVDAVNGVGQVYCWGFNGQAQFGYPADGNHPTPKLIAPPAGVSGWVAVKGGDRFTNLVGADGLLYFLSGIVRYVPLP